MLFPILMKGLALTRVPKIKFVVIIGGARFPTEDIAEKAYVPRLHIPSLHFLGRCLCFPVANFSWLVWFYNVIVVALVMPANVRLRLLLQITKCGCDLR